MDKPVRRQAELVGHAGGVNCVRFGQRSGKFFISGGEDKKAKLWKIGSPDALVTLANSNSPIDSTALEFQEKFGIVGSASGTIRFWDLTENKVVRTFLGHKSNVSYVEHHPFGEFFASGGADCLVRVWDVRRKSCIQTYRSHSARVTCLRFTPDGRWILSASEDGHVKLCDMTAGKVLHDFADHTGSVTSLAVHPQEFLLATGSIDRQIRLWDLENFGATLGTTNADSTGIRALSFSQNGEALISASADSLKVYQWDPSPTCLDVCTGLPWQRLADLATYESSSPSASAVTMDGEFIGTWNIDLSRLAPWSSGSNNIVDSGVSERAGIPSRTKPQEVTPNRRKRYDSTSNQHELSAAHHAKSDSDEDIQFENEDIDNNPDKQDKVNVDPPISKAAGLKVADFLPKSSDSEVDSASNDKGEEELAEQLRSNHFSMIGVMTSRLMWVRRVRIAWQGYGPIAAAKEARESKDIAVANDFISVLNARRDQVDLNLAISIMPLLSILLSSSKESYIITSCTTIRILVRSSLIHHLQGLRIHRSPGIDLSGEERVRKLESFRDGLVGFKKQLEGLNKLKGRVGETVRELSREMLAAIP